MVQDQLAVGKWCAAICKQLQVRSGAFHPATELVQSSIDVRWIAVVLDREIVLIDWNKFSVDGDAVVGIGSG